MKNSSALLTCEFSDDKQPYHNHTHLSCELIYVKKGKARFIINQTPYEVSEGTVVFISSLEEHSVEILQTPYERYFMTISSAVLEKQIRSPKLTSIFKNRPRGFRHCLPTADNRTEVQHILQQIFVGYRSGNAFEDELTACLLEQLLILLYRTTPAGFPLPDKLINTEVLSIQQYIERHFTEQIRIAQLAEKHFISVDYLSHTFKQLTGYSPKQYILLNRLAYGRELLMQSGMQINVVAYKCGFGDTNNFIRSFKKQFGVTPNQYRKG